MLVLLTWGIAVVVVLFLAAETSLGPVVLTLGRRHGIHFGDLVALVVGGGAALFVTAAIVARYVRR